MNIFGFIKEESSPSERKELAQEMWPDMGDQARYVSVSKLVNGKYKTIQIGWVRIICERFGIDPNSLFGYPWRKKVVIKKKKV